MTTDEVIMQEMLDRATNPAQDDMDELGIQMFCMVVRSNVLLVQKAQEMILTKIRSSNVTEATRAIVLLEECMAKCGGEFQDEIAKNRFLNNFIMLVLKKFQGDATPTAVKQRIMECLLLWATEYPQKKKIRTVYDMLSKEGEVQLLHMPAMAVPVSAPSFPKRESILGKDEETLAKLLKSGDPDDLKCANLLIQNRVKQDSRRTELILRHKSELQEVQMTVKVLNDMLDAYESEGHDLMDEHSESMAVMRELLISCKRHKPIVKHLPELIEKNDEALMVDTLETLESLRKVMERYKQIVVHPPTKTPESTAVSSSSSTPFASTQKSDVDLFAVLTEKPQPVLAANVGGGDGFLGSKETGDSVNDAPSAEKAIPVSNTLELDELREIFCDSAVNTDTSAKLTDNKMSKLFGSLDLLEPENVFAASQVGQSNGGSGDKAAERRTFGQLPEIDKLSEELFKQIQPTADQRVGTFKKESAEKLKTLNDLVKSKTAATLNQPKGKASTTTSKSSLLLSPSSIDSFDLLSSAKLEHDSDELETSESLGDDDQMLTAEIVKESLPPVVSNTSKSTTPLPSQHLSDISIDLDSLTPLEKEQLLFEDDDIKIMLIFTKDRPSKNVAVIVVSILNKSKMHVKEFQLDASVKKPSKVRLLAPSGNTMPPFKQFRPAVLINQVLLLLNPTGKPIDISCIVGYKLGDDPDPNKELIVAKNIPYVE